VPHFSQLTLSAGVSVTVTLYLAPHAHFCVPVSHSTNSVTSDAVNKFAVNLSSDFVDNKYFKVLIVPQAVIAEVLRHFFAQSLIASEFVLNSMPTRSLFGIAVVHIEKELLHSGGSRLRV
jgi:hypothetical protein